MTRITVGAMKGGIAKTTTAVHVALGLARTGRTLLVDADPRASTSLDWSTVAGPQWPTTVIPWHGPDLARRVADVAGDYSHVVIDTGGDSTTVLEQALMVTDELLVPMSPSLLDLRRLPATVELASRIDAIHPLTYRVLLCRVRPGTRSAVEARAMLDELAVPCMAAEVRLREVYPARFGTAPTDLLDYEAVIDELSIGIDEDGDPR